MNDSGDATSLSAQEKPPILSAADLQKGIYKTFEEFLSNTPSIHSHFQIVTDSGPKLIERGTADYRLVFSDSVFKRKEIRNFWGVCDGQSIYINETNYGGSLNFKKLHGIGRYCYFKGSVVDAANDVYTTTVAGGAIAGTLAAAAVAIDGDHPYILNLNNGKFFLLDKAILKTILKKDPELDSAYEEEERKSKKHILLSYIIKYNARHENEIKYKQLAPVSITFYRRQKKERAEPIILTVCNSLHVSLEPNSIEQITWMSDSVDVCIDSNCKTISLAKKGTNYVECSWKSKQEDFKPVKVEVGEFYEREIRILTKEPDNDTPYTETRHLRKHARRISRYHTKQGNK